MNSNQPLVSCIMPTMASRASFVPLAVSYFLRQDYPAAELIIVDEDIGSLQIALPETDRIRHFRVSLPGRLGTKRNYACEQARGDIIMHWDDDDWYPPDWISRQVRLMEESGADICGLDRPYFFSPEQRRCWQYVYPALNRPWVFGATLAYRKSCWQRYPFRAIQIGEDNDFVWNSGGKIIAHPHPPGFVSILHGGNTSPKYTDNPMWYSRPLTEVDAVMGEDMRHYVDMSVADIHK